jgi:hypothetical protein
VLGGGFTRDWLVEGGSAIQGLRTPYGSLDFGLRLDGDRLVATVGGSARPPAGFLLPASCFLLSASRSPADAVTPASTAKR